jgi:hypothetical protein
MSNALPERMLVPGPEELSLKKRDNENNLL